MKKEEWQKSTICSSVAEYLIFIATINNKDSIEIRYEGENLWLTQRMMSNLFDVDIQTLNSIIEKIFEDSELTENEVIRNLKISDTDKKTCQTAYYNLQMAIAISFRVNTDRATQFRKWVNQVLKDYIIQGWTIDTERLKRGHSFTDDYFARQLQEIKEIRLSERNSYQKITDLYATAFDYDKDAKITKQFYQTMKGKLHWFLNNLTAFNEKIVSLYLDYAQQQAVRRIPMSMEDWVNRLNIFLKFNEFSETKKQTCFGIIYAGLHTETEFEKYQIMQGEPLIEQYIPIYYIRVSKFQRPYKPQEGVLPNGNTPSI